MHIVLSTALTVVWMYTQVPTPIPQVSRSNSISSITSNIQLLTSYYKSTRAADQWIVFLYSDGSLKILRLDLY